MNALLDELKTEWKKFPEYKDVEAEYWVPGQDQIEKCPNGCRLEIYEDTEDTIVKWGGVSGRDAYRQTRICREHGFVRIYVITGPAALATNWSPQNS